MDRNWGADFTYVVNYDVSFDGELLLVHAHRPRAIAVRSHGGESRVGSAGL